MLIASLCAFDMNLDTPPWPSVNQEYMKFFKHESTDQAVALQRRHSSCLQVRIELERTGFQSYATDPRDWKVLHLFMTRVGDSTNSCQLKLGVGSIQPFTHKSQ